MSNHYGRNESQARIASVGASKKFDLEGLLKIAKKIGETGVGMVAINRAQRRFEQKQSRRNKK